MKQWNNMLTMAIMAIAMTMGLAACSDDDPVTDSKEPEPTNMTYTIMLYGVGGGNLDEDLTYNLEELNYSDRVNFTGLVKYSKQYQDDSEKAGTLQLDLTKDEGLKCRKVHEASYRMDNPQNLADFIKDSKMRYPADKYILIFWNHGSPFDVSDQPVLESYPEISDAKEIQTRGVVYDDNIKGNKGMSIFEMEEALKRSGAKIDLIYWDLCLMNGIENLYQIKDYTHYVMGAEHVTYASNYALFMHNLESHATLEDALKAYVPAMIDYWKNLTGKVVYSEDLTVTDMTKIEPVVKAFKDYADELIMYRSGLEKGSRKEELFYYYNSLYEEKDKKKEYSNAGGILYNIDDDYDDCVDLGSACVRLAGRLLNGKLTRLAMVLELALKDMILVNKANNVPVFITNTSISINWSFLPYYIKEYNQYPDATNSMCKLYPLLRFDQKTGWHRFLEMNEFRLSSPEVDED